jgi:hypothetical protein
MAGTALKVAGESRYREQIVTVTEATAILRWRRFGQRQGQLIVGLRNAGAAWAQVVPEETSWTVPDEDGLTLASGTFFEAFPAYVPPGDVAWLWTPVSHRAASANVDPVWETSGPVADATFAIESTASVTRSRRVRARVAAESEDVGDARAQFALIALGASGAPIGAGSNVLPLEFRPGQRREFRLTTLGPVSRNESVSHLVVVNAVAS